MKKSDYGLLQVRYKKNSEIDKIIQNIEMNGLNKSEMVRKYLIHARGYSYLKSVNTPSHEIRKHLVNSIQFYAGELEVAKIHLELESNSNSQAQDIVLEKSFLL